MSLPTACPVRKAVSQLADVLQAVAPENVLFGVASGRFLAQPLVADRPSPPCDVSAMDGYAVRLDDVRARQPLPVVATSPAGRPPRKFEAGTAIKIFTGGAIPHGADLVIQRELANETDGRVTFHADALTVGKNIRRQGENIAAGQTVLPAGTHLNAAAMSAIATFSTGVIPVHRLVRVAVLTTGDEVVPVGAVAEPWQIRDSNGPLLAALLHRLPFVNVIMREQIADDLSSLMSAIGQSLEAADAVLMTGGVSAGDLDLVPGALEQCGVRRIFHKLPLRPGRPVYGGVGPRGQLVLGLPGNPVSVAVTARIIGQPLLQVLGGGGLTAGGLLVPNNDPPSDLPLVHYRLAHIDADGRCHVAPTRGSGDVVALAASDGLLEFNPFVPAPDAQRHFYRWV